MSDTVQATGIVIRRVRHGESSLILTAFTREFGRVGLMAKGARGKSRSFASAALEVFCETQFVFYRKRGRDLQLLKECSLVTAHSGLRSNLQRLTVASAAVELLGRCLRDDDTHPELYAATSELLRALDRQPLSPLPLLWRFELSMLSALGFALNFSGCPLTGRPLIAPFSSAIRFNLHDACFYHPDAATPPLVHGELSADSFSLLSCLPNASEQFLEKLSIPPRAQKELTDFLHRFLEVHLPVSARLRSLDALQWSGVFCAGTSES